MFISFEGTDGAGKSLQIELFKKYLEDTLKKEVTLVRDPGSTSISEKLREIVLGIDNKEMCPRCEALIYSASRAQMVHEIVLPAIEKGHFVLADRFIDSSLAYQGIARNLGVKQVKDINNFAVDNVYPELTFFLNLDPKTSLERKNLMKELDRIEIENENFHENVRNGYLEVAKSEPNRVKIIDANGTIEDIHLKIIEVFNDYIKNK